jgi:hypothetical protein
MTTPSLRAADQDPDCPNARTIPNVKTRENPNSAKKLSACDERTGDGLRRPSSLATPPFRIESRAFLIGPGSHGPRAGSLSGVLPHARGSTSPDFRPRGAPQANPLPLPSRLGRQTRRARRARKTKPFRIQSWKSVGLRSYPRLSTARRRRPATRTNSPKVQATGQSNNLCFSDCFILSW